MPDEPTTFTRVLEKRLEVATRQKTWFMVIAIVAVVALLLVLALVYKTTVLDYARITNVVIQQQGRSPTVDFAFDVQRSGKIEYRYGGAVLMDRVKSGEHETFSWAWGEGGEIEVGIRSRGAFLPKRHTKTIQWSMEEQLEAE